MQTEKAKQKSAPKKAKEPKKPKLHAVPEDLAAVVLEAFRTVPSVRGAQLKKSLPKPYQPFDVEALAVVRELVFRGQIYRRTKGTTEIFFAIDPFTTLAELVPRLLGNGPQDSTALKVAVAKAAPGHEDALQEWLPHALAKQLLFEHPPAPPAKKRRYGIAPHVVEPDVAGSLKTVLTALRKAVPGLEKQGVTRRRIADVLLAELGLPSAANAAPAETIRGEFLTALDKLGKESPNQALLSVRDLRDRLSLEKHEFDAVALELAREGAVSLHHHDHPGSLTELERARLIRDARGTHYIGIARRKAQ